MIATLGHAMKKLFVLSILFTSLSSGHGAPFQNLDFERAKINTGAGKTTDLMPGWNLPNYPFDLMNFNAYAIGSGNIAIPAIWQTDVYNQLANQIILFAAPSP